MNLPRPLPPLVSLVIPCYNEEAVLGALFQRVAAAAESWGCPWEVICVDDGSSDRTWEMLEAQHRRDSRWRALSLARNFGQQTAISAGLFHALGAVAMIIDADLQDPPEQLARFLERWRDGFDVVYGVRVKRKGSPLKRFAYWAFYRFIARASSLPIPRDSGDFCLMDQRVVAVLKSMPERQRFLRGMRVWSGFRQVGISYERPARAAGKTKYTLRKLLNLAFDGIFAFSDVPLKLAVYLGFAVMAASVAWFAFLLVRAVLPVLLPDVGREPVDGSSIVAAAMVFVGGVQLLCTGLLGEYIGRVYTEVKRRPQWVVRDAAGVLAQPPPV